MERLALLSLFCKQLEMLKGRGLSQKESRVQLELGVEAGCLRGKQGWVCLGFGLPASQEIKISWLQNGF